MRSLRSLVACALALCFLSACAFSRQVAIRSHPSGAQAWLGSEPLGPTPTRARPKTTGFIEGYTFDPESVTFKLRGHKRTVHALDYKWSLRNIVASVVTVVGLPGLVLYTKEPVDLWVVLTPETGKAAPEGQ
jgi:hypothetical protein